MASFIRISPILEKAGSQVFFQCPGCGLLHGVCIEPDGSRAVWNWNGDVNRPTFTPSILVRWEQGEPPCDNLEVAEKVRNGEIVQTIASKTCHSFVTDGQIRFLEDCTHPLAGQTVTLPLLEEND